MKIIGLTGGIASGKSTVARMIRKKRIPVICADLIARQAVKPGTPLLKKLSRRFGKEILPRAGRLNRKKLAGIVFASPEKRLSLNKLIHPEVIRAYRTKLKEHRQKGTQLVFMDVPLLFETGMDKMCEQTVCVWAPQSTQAKRLKERDLLHDEAVLLRLKSQMPIDEKKKKADYVIDNSGTVEKTKTQVMHLLQTL